MIDEKLTKYCEYRTFVKKVKGLFAIYTVISKNIHQLSENWRNYKFDHIIAIKLPICN